MQNIGKVSPWPVQRDFGGVMVISQGLGGDLSMWLPDIMELEFNPVVQMGASYPETPVQNAEPFRSWNQMKALLGGVRQLLWMKEEFM